MHPTFRGMIAGLGLGILPVFSGAAQAQENRCAPFDILQYDLQREGQTIQSRGTITTSPDIPDHRFELYGNTYTSQWTLVEFKGEEDPCFYKVGSIFFNENAQEGDGEITNRQSGMARHGNGDGSNEMFELYVNEGTNRWVMTRRISETKADIILAGSHYEEYNSAPFNPVIDAGIDAVTP